MSSRTQCHRNRKRAAGRGRAVEIAGGIENQAAVARIEPVGATSEVMQNRLRPFASRRGRQLEHRAAAGALIVVTAGMAADFRCAVEIAGRIEDQAAAGAIAVRRVVEVVKNLFRSDPAGGGRQLEDRTAVSVGAI